MANAMNGAPHGSKYSDSDDEGQHIHDGICEQCFMMGRSKLETRNVAGFRSIIVRAFECEDCGHRSEEVQLAGQYAEQGVRLTLAVPQGCATTLGRAVLKSDTATISIPELEFEIGAGAYVPFAGDLSTVGELLMQACRNLNMNQAERHQQDADTASKIDEFIQELESYAAGEHAFTFVVEDNAGNSYISGPDGGPANGAAEGDTQLTVEHYRRTAAQESRMGLAMPDEFLPEEEEREGEGEQGVTEPASAPGRLILRVEGQAEAQDFMGKYAAAAPLLAAPEGVQRPAVCPACGAGAGAGFSAAAHAPAEGFIHSCVLVSSSCSSCSVASVEVRSTGGVSAQGTQLRLRVSRPADLERAVLQSASASIALPELELALSSGGSGGMVTTVGQLISNLAGQLGSSAALQAGAAAVEGAEAEQAEWGGFLSDLRSFASLDKPWTLELTDPLDSSFVSAAPGDAEEPEGSVTISRYDRTPDENEHFGLARGGGAAPIA